VVGKISADGDEEAIMMQASSFFSSHHSTASITRREIEDANDDDSGLLIFNWGVHCNHHDVSCMTKVLTKLVKLTQNEKLQNVQFMFREHEPQHFGTESGLFQGGDEAALECKAIETIDDWRNEAAATFLQKHGLTKRVKTVSIFKELVSLHQIHYFGDCTHYCYNPLRFEVTWKAILDAMQEFDRDMAPYEELKR